MGAMIEEGRPAPDFTLTSDAGTTVSLSDFRGSAVVLYFYPKDDSRTSNHSKPDDGCSSTLAIADDATRHGYNEGKL